MQTQPLFPLVPSTAVRIPAVSPKSPLTASEPCIPNTWPPVWPLTQAIKFIPVFFKASREEAFLLSIILLFFPSMNMTQIYYATKPLPIRTKMPFMQCFRALLTACLALYLSLGMIHSALAQQQELTSADDHALLYAKQMQFAADGSPVIRMRIAYTITARAPQPGEYRYAVILFRSRNQADLNDAKELYKNILPETDTIALGSIFALKGKVFDNREHLLLTSKTNQKQSFLRRIIMPNFDVNAWERQKLVKRLISIDENAWYDIKCQINDLAPLLAWKPIGLEEYTDYL